MAGISEQEFEERLAKQKQQKQILKWRELDEGTIYEISSFNFIKTMHGKACVITLSDDRQVFAPSTLEKRLVNLEDLPVFVRPKGLTKSKTSGNKYYDFDLVVWK